MRKVLHHFRKSVASYLPRRHWVFGTEARRFWHRAMERFWHRATEVLFAALDRLSAKRPARERGSAAPVER
jgi:hypothetical protein